MKHCISFDIKSYSPYRRLSNIRAGRWGGSLVDA